MVRIVRFVIPRHNRHFTSPVGDGAALSLANDDLPDMHGVLTPGGVMGAALLERLPRVGIQFQVREDASRTIKA